MKPSPLTAVLIDDEAKSRKNLHRLLETYCKEVQVVGEAESVEEAADLLQKIHPDVVFLDVEMSDGSGFHFLERFPERSFHVVFVTAHSHYAIKAIKHAATDYLLKPLDIDDLIQAVNKIVPREKPTIKTSSEKKQTEYLEIKVKYSFVYAPLKDIVRREADGSYTQVYLQTGEKYCLPTHIGAVEEKLPEHFFRAHKSHLINLRLIKRISRNDFLVVEMADGASIDVSRRAKAKFLEAIKSS